MPGRPGGRFGKSFYRNLSDEEKTFYKGYLDGTNTHTVPRAISAEKRARVALAIVPFGKVPSAAAAAATDFYKVSATTQAIGIAKLIEANLTVFGIAETPDEASLSQSGFYPALAKPTLRAAADTGDDTAKSSFTNRTYTKYSTRSGSIPFGRSKTAATTTDYTAQQSAIATAFNGAELTGNKKVSLSFVPEYWDKGQSSTSSNASTVTAGIDF